MLISNRCICPLHGADKLLQQLCLRLFVLQAISRIHTLIKLGQAQLEAFSKTTKEPSNASPNQRVPSALIVFDAVSPVRMCEYYFHQVPRGLWDTKTY